MLYPLLPWFQCLSRGRYKSLSIFVGCLYREDIIRLEVSWKKYSYIQAYPQTLLCPYTCAGGYPINIIINAIICCCYHSSCPSGLTEAVHNTFDLFFSASMLAGSRVVLSHQFTFVRFSLQASHLRADCPKQRNYTLGLDKKSFCDLCTSTKSISAQRFLKKKRRETEEKKTPLFFLLMKSKNEWCSSGSVLNAYNFMGRRLSFTSCEP